MSSTTLTPAAALPRLDWPFLIAAVLGTTVLVALVALDGQPASAALLILGFALGAAFLKAEFSFTAAWRRFLVHGEAGGLIGALLLIARRRVRDRAGRGAGARLRRRDRARSARRWSSAPSCSASACSLRTAAAPARSTRQAAAPAAC